MLVASLAVAIVLQMSSTQIQELRKYRYGLTSTQIEAMGRDAYERLFERRTPQADSGAMRGVAYGVYVDAYRENTARRYRALLAPAIQTRRLALDRQMRLIGVLFARNDWLFTGGNAWDPESDDLEMAKAERRIYTLRSGVPDETAMRRRLDAYQKAVRDKARSSRIDGASNDAEGRSQIEKNLTKMNVAVARATAFCRSPAERTVLFEFVAARAARPTW